MGRAARAARLGERDAERLEDRLEHVLGVAALDQPDVERQPGALGQLAQELGDDVGLEPADAGVGEVDVGDDERPARRLEGDVRERLVRRHRRGAVAAHAGVAQLGRERLAERASGSRHLVGGRAGLHLQRQVERRVLGEQRDQVVEDREAGRDRRLRLPARPPREPAGEVRPARQPSTRSIRAPSPRRRSSIRS